jgi:hypothetical protein
VVQSEEYGAARGRRPQAHRVAEETMQKKPTKDQIAGAKHVKAKTKTLRDLAPTTMRTERIKGGGSTIVIKSL